MSLSSNQSIKCRLYHFWRWQYLNRNQEFIRDCTEASGSEEGLHRVARRWGSAVGPVFCGQRVVRGEELVTLFESRRFEIEYLPHFPISPASPTRYVFDKSQPEDLGRYLGVSYDDPDGVEFALMVNTSRPIERALADVVFCYRMAGLRDKEDAGESTKEEFATINDEWELALGEINAKVAGAAPEARALGLLLFDYMQETGCSQAEVARAPWVGETVPRLGLDRVNPPDLERYCSRTKACIVQAEVLPLKKK